MSQRAKQQAVGRSRAARPRAPRRLRQAPPARALGWDAPTRRSGAGALAQNADVLLMDEPFGALDTMTPRPAARRARSAMDLDRQDDHLRHAQRAQGRAPRRLRGATSRTSPATSPPSSTTSASHVPATIDSPEVATSGRDNHRPTPWKRYPGWPSATGVEIATCRSPRRRPGAESRFWSKDVVGDVAQAPRDRNRGGSVWQIAVWAKWKPAVPRAVAVHRVRHRCPTTPIS